MSINRTEALALRDQQKRAHAFMCTLLVKEQTPEIRSQVDRVLSDMQALDNKIKKLENPGTYVSDMSYVTPDESRHTVAFERFVRGGLDSLTSEQRTLLTSKRETRDISEGGDQTAHIGSYSGLGYFVPTGFVAMVEQAKKFYCDFSTFAGEMKTSSGNALPFPISNDVANAATVVGEGIETTEVDPASTNHVVFGAHKLKSGLIKASNELLTDSGIDVSAWLAERFAERFGRGEANYFTNGSGSGQPEGVLTAIAASGATPVTAVGSAANSGGSEDGTNSIGYADLVQLEHSVDPSYRRNAKYMLHDNTLGQLKKILDKFGRPLWAPGISVGEPSTINGYAYEINQAMPTIAPSATTMVFGDFSKFIVRRVASMSVRRLVERYAEFDQVGFLAFERVDSRLMDAGTHPLNVLQQHS
jgi:HK97 family phage major capsid protein